MRQDSRRRDSCPRAKEILKEGIGCVAEGAVGEIPREGEEERAADRAGLLAFPGCRGSFPIHSNGHYFPISAANVITVL